MTRTVVGNISLSLDGRVTGPGGEHDMGWIVPHALTDQARAHLLELIDPATTVLLGRRNYQGFGGFWPAVAGDGHAHPRDRAFARWLDQVEKVVVTRTLTQTGWRNSRIEADQPAEVVRRLRKQDGGDIVVVGSGGLIRELLEAGGLDRPCITLCPGLVVVGGPRGPLLLVTPLPPQCGGAGPPPVRRRPGRLLLVPARGDARRQRGTV